MRNMPSLYLSLQFRCRKEFNELLSTKLEYVFNWKHFCLKYLEQVFGFSKHTNYIHEGIPLILYLIFPIFYILLTTGITVLR